jgi:hypothetical protein
VVRVRDVVEEVDVDRWDPARASAGDGLRDVAGAMPAAESAKLGIVERLGAERDPRDAGVGQARRVAALIGPGIRLERDLRIRRDAEAPADSLRMRSTSAGGSSDGVPPPR